MKNKENEIISLVIIMLLVFSPFVLAEGEDDKKDSDDKNFELSGLAGMFNSMTGSKAKEMGKAKACPTKIQDSADVWCVMQYPDPKEFEDGNLKECNFEGMQKQFQFYRCRTDGKGGFDVDNQCDQIGEPKCDKPMPRMKKMLVHEDSAKDGANAMMNPSMMGNNDDEEKKDSENKQQLGKDMCTDEIDKSAEPKEDDLEDGNWRDILSKKWKTDFKLDPEEDILGIDGSTDESLCLEFFENENVEDAVEILKDKLVEIIEDQSDLKQVSKEIEDELDYDDSQVKTLADQIDEVKAESTDEKKKEAFEKIRDDIGDAFKKCTEEMKWKETVRKLLDKKAKENEDVKEKVHEAFGASCMYYQLSPLMFNNLENLMPKDGKYGVMGMDGKVSSCKSLDISSWSSSALQDWGQGKYNDGTSDNSSSSDSSSIMMPMKLAEYCTPQLPCWTKGLGGMGMMMMGGMSIGCYSEPEMDAVFPDEAEDGPTGICHECEAFNGDKEADDHPVTDDKGQCEPIAKGTVNVGENGVLSISGGGESGSSGSSDSSKSSDKGSDKGSSDKSSSSSGENDCVEKHKFKICANLQTLGEKAYVGTVCVDKGYEGKSSDQRPRLNLPPNEVNPDVEGEPKFCNNEIKGLKKMKQTEEEDPWELNVSLLRCPEQVNKSISNYKNLGNYVDTVILFYENFVEFYTQLHDNLEMIHKTVKEQCKSCESEIEKMNKKYQKCGLEVQLGKIPHPSECMKIAQKACKDKSTCKKDNKGKSKCEALCDAVPCNYGDNCKSAGVPAMAGGGQSGQGGQGGQEGQQGSSSESESGSKEGDDSGSSGGEKAQCWSNQYFCGDETPIGSADQHGGIAGCAPAITPTNVAGKAACCVHPYINQQSGIGAATAPPGGLPPTGLPGTDNLVDPSNSQNMWQTDAPGMDWLPKKQLAQAPQGGSSDNSPYSLMNQGCYKENQIIAEAWHTLETKQAKISLPSPKKVYQCAHQMADLKDLCELDKIKGGDKEGEGNGFYTPCEIEERMDKIIKYLDNVLENIPKVITELEGIKKKFSKGLKEGATYDAIKGHLDRIDDLMKEIDEYDPNKKMNLTSEQKDDKKDKERRRERIMSTDKFQKEITWLITYLQKDALRDDLVKIKHSYPTKVSLLVSDEEVSKIEFPAGTHPTLIYKTDAPEKWDTFCSNWNVKKCGERPEEKQKGGDDKEKDGGDDKKSDYGDRGSSSESESGSKEGGDENGGQDDKIDAKPPIQGCGGYRGACSADTPEVEIADINIDEWGKKIIMSIEEFRKINVRDIFVKGKDCFSYDIPVVSMCDDLCSMCYKTRQAHCHLEKAVCICEKRTEWRPTSFVCNEKTTNSTDAEKVMNCCNYVFMKELELELESIDTELGEQEITLTPINFNVTTLGKKDNKTLFSPELCVAQDSIFQGVTFDKCQTQQSETGICCKYGFDERGVSKVCMENKACQIACKKEFPTNQNKQLKCENLCRQTKAACEISCLKDMDTSEKEQHCMKTKCQTPKKLMECMFGCSDIANEKDQEMCAIMCKITYPQIEVTIDTWRELSPVRSVYAQDELRVNAKVKNNGVFEFSGQVELAFAVLSNCTCPECPSGMECPCQCEDNVTDTLGVLDIPLLDAKKTAEFLSNPFTVANEYAGEVIQPVAMVKDIEGDEIDRVKGELVTVIKLDNTLSVFDAYFTVNDEIKTKSVFEEGKTAKGHIKFKASMAPLTFDMYAVVEEAEIEGTRKTITFDHIDKEDELTTEEIPFSKEYIGFIVRIKVEAKNSTDGDLIIDKVLQEQVTENFCHGTEMTKDCYENKDKLEMSYPRGFLEVAKPSLNLRDYQFTNRENFAIKEMYGKGKAKIHIKAEQIIDEEFTGKLEVFAVDDQNVALDESRTTMDLTGKENKIELTTGMFSAFPGNTYSIAMQGTGTQGDLWIDDILSHEDNPYARLQVYDAAQAIQGDSVDISTTIRFEGCTLEVECDLCSPLCELHVDTDTCELKPKNCGCQCRATQV